MYWRTWLRTEVAGRVGLWLVTLLLTCATVVPSRADQSCDDASDCTDQDVCTADGGCTGKPKADGSPCTGQLTGGCIVSGQCMALPFPIPGLAASICEPIEKKAPGTECTIPGLSDVAGKCLLSAQCNEDGFCEPTPKICPTPTDHCSVAFCNPSTGDCETLPKCNDACSTATCNPDTGACGSKQPINEGQPCNDGKVCTTNDRCSNGVCGASTTPVATGTTTPTPTATPTSQPSDTPTATPTPTSTANPCVGDCGDDGVVTINDVVIGTDIAFDPDLLDECPSFDANNDNQVKINELVTGVHNALVGCPTPVPTQTPTLTPTAPPPTLTPTPTPTLTQTPSATPTNTSTHTPIVTTTHTPLASATPTPSPTATLPATATPTITAGGPSTATPTVTPTQGGAGIPERVAGFIPTSTNALLVVPNILSALLGHTPGLGSNSGSAAGLISLPFTCPSGGGGQLACNQTITGFPPTFGPPTYDVTLSNCAVSGLGGATLTFNGDLTATGQSGEICGVTIPSEVTLSIPNLTITSSDTNGTTTATFTNVSGSVLLAGQDDNCTYSTATFMLVGTIGVVVKDAQGTPLASTSMTFAQGSSLVISVTQYGANCVPTVYDVIANGTMTFSTSGHTFATTLTDYTVHNDATSGKNMIEVSGGIASPCLGTAVQLATVNDLLLPDAEPCPQGGAVTVMSGNTTDKIIYGASGGVGIDLGNDGSVNQTFNTCLDSALSQCSPT